MHPQATEQKLAPRVWSNQILHGDALTMLRMLPSRIADVCITSPPYWSLRDYGVAGQMGLEGTPDEYVASLVSVFREVKRVLKPGRTLWLVLGDTYYSGAGPCLTPGGKSKAHHPRGLPPNRQPRVPGLKPKDLVGIPWRVALELQADGWWLRNAIVWHKTNAPPSSIKDRMSCRYELVFLLASAARYQFNLDAIREPYTSSTIRRMATASGAAGKPTASRVDTGRLGVRLPPQPEVRPFLHGGGKNPGDVWSISHRSSRAGHHAVFPEELARKAILAGSKARDLVLDPFCGTGTSLVVAKTLERSFLGIELHPRFVSLARRRLSEVPEVKAGAA